MKPSIFDWATVSVLVKRDVKRFFRQKSRVAGALIQPFLFWLILSAGFTKSFQAPGIQTLSYKEFSYPGVILMMVLFTALFATMSVIEDRNEGFLQGVLAAPSSRGALVMGKTLGGTFLAMIQVALFLVLLPLAGFHFNQASWLPLIFILFLSAFALNAFGFFLAWWLNSVQGYHVMMSLVLMPLWLISGAIFPLDGSSPWLKRLSQFNPMAYGVEGLRNAFYGGHSPIASGLIYHTFYFQYLVLGLLALLAFLLALYKCKSQRV